MVFLALAVWSFPFGVLDCTVDAILAACVAVGGVLVLKRHRQGPAWAGLASIFLCFFAAWNVVMNMLGALSTGKVGQAFARLVFLVIVFSIPAGITVWCLREERKIQQEEAEDGY